MFQDPRDTKSDNRKRRTEKMETLKQAMLNPKELLRTAFSGGMMRLEKFENYIYAFILVSRKEDRNYGKALMWGNYLENMEGLFFAEKECISGSSKLYTMASYIPYIDFSSDSVVECAVIDISTLPAEETELIETNYENSKTVISSNV